MCPQLRELVAAGCIAAIAGCAAAAEHLRRAVPNYDDFTGRLIQLNADQNGDGRIDQWIVPGRQSPDSRRSRYG